MRKKILALIMVATMLATTLVGCGKDTTGENTIDETVNVESTESVEPTESTESSGTLGDIANEPIESETPSTEDENESEVEETTEYGMEYSLNFPFDETIANGYTHKFEYLNDASMSYNETHYENIVENFIIDISWIGPSELGVKAKTTNANDLLIYDRSENYLKVNIPETLDEETWQEYVEIDEVGWKEIGYCTEYSGDEYFSKTMDSDIIDIIFEINEIDNDNQGYGRQIVNNQEKKIYTFVYQETREIYDANRALDVIESIKILTQ